MSLTSLSFKQSLNGARERSQDGESRKEKEKGTKVGYKCSYNYAGYYYHQHSSPCVCLRVLYLCICDNNFNTSAKRLHGHKCDCMPDSCSLSLMSPKCNNKTKSLELCYQRLYFELNAKVMLISSQ